MKALARKHTKAAIERLAFWMASDNPKASVSASVSILNRAWGTPAQAVTVSGDADAPFITRVIHEDADRG